MLESRQPALPRGVDMRRPQSILVLVALAVLVIAVGVVATGGTGPGEERAVAATGFHPRSVTGKWTGQWRNLTFDSQGSIRANLRFNADNKRFIPTIDFGGMMWGCVDNPPAEVVVLTKGTGMNTWNANGFRVQTESEAGGTVTLRYTHDDHVLKGNGTAADCNEGTTFTLQGKLFPNSFNATVSQDFPGPQTGTVKLSADKQD